MCERHVSKGRVSKGAKMVSFFYPIIVHILLDPLSDMCHNKDS